MTLLELIQLLRKRIAFVIALPFILAAMVAVWCLLFVPSVYTAQTSMYVLYTGPDGTSHADSSTLNTSQLIANDVAKLFSSDRVRNGALETTGMESLNGYSISVQSDSDTRVIYLFVTGPDAQSSAAIANAMAENVSEVAQEVMAVEAVNVLDSAAVPEYPSGPNRPMYVVAAFLAGLFLAIAIVVIVDMLDTRVRNADEVTELTGVPVIGRFPVMR